LFPGGSDFVDHSAPLGEFVVTVIPSAILFARLYTFLTGSIRFFSQLSSDYPNSTAVLFWILPTLAATLLVNYLLVDRHIIVLRKAKS
jgi:hypothetical protein